MGNIEQLRPILSIAVSEIEIVLGHRPVLPDIKLVGRNIVSKRSAKTPTV